MHLDDVFKAFDADGDGKISADDEHHNWEALFLANMWLAQSEMIEQHEHSFHVWSDAKRKGRGSECTASAVKSLTSTLRWTL